MAVWLLVGALVGIVLIGLGVVALIRSRESRPAQPPPLSQQVVRKIDPGGKIGLEKLKCQECGARLGRDNIAVESGVTFVSCPYCGSAYQLVEEPNR